MTQEQKDCLLDLIDSIHGDTSCALLELDQDNESVFRNGVDRLRTYANRTQRQSKQIRTIIERIEINPEQKPTTDK